MDGLGEALGDRRSSASKNAHEKSERVLMFVEYALRLSASAISSVAATSAFRITSKVTDHADARSGAGKAGTSAPGRLRRAYAAGHPYTSRARPGLTLPSRTSVSTSAGSRSAGGP